MLIVGPPNIRLSTKNKLIVYITVGISLLFAVLQVSFGFNLLVRRNMLCANADAHAFKLVNPCVPLAADDPRREYIPNVGWKLWVPTLYIASASAVICVLMCYFFGVLYTQQRIMRAYEAGTVIVLVVSNLVFSIVFLAMENDGAFTTVKRIDHECIVQRPQAPPEADFCAYFDAYGMFAYSCTLIAVLKLVMAVSMYVARTKYVRETQLGYEFYFEQTKHQYE